MQDGTELRRDPTAEITADVLSSLGGITLRELAAQVGTDPARQLKFAAGVLLIYESLELGAVPTQPSGLTAERSITPSSASSSYELGKARQKEPGSRKGISPQSLTRNIKLLNRYFAGVLDEDEVTALFGANEAVLDSFFIGVADAYAAVAHKPGYSTMHAQRLRALVEGCSIQEVASENGVSPSAIYQSADHVSATFMTVRREIRSAFIALTSDSSSNESNNASDNNTDNMLTGAKPKKAEVLPDEKQEVFDEISAMVEPYWTTDEVQGIDKLLRGDVEGSIEARARLSELMARYARFAPGVDAATSKAGLRMHERDAMRRLVGFDLRNGVMLLPIDRIEGMYKDKFEKGGHDSFLEGIISIVERLVSCAIRDKLYVWSETAAPVAPETVLGSVSLGGSEAPSTITDSEVGLADQDEALQSQPSAEVKDCAIDKEDSLATLDSSDSGKATKTQQPEMGSTSHEDIPEDPFVSDVSGDEDHFEDLDNKTQDANTGSIEPISSKAKEERVVTLRPQSDGAMSAEDIAAELKELGVTVKAVRQAEKRLKGTHGFVGVTRNVPGRATARYYKGDSLDKLRNELIT